MMEKQERLTLLRKTQALINVERSLTLTLAKVEPWLSISSSSSNNNNNTGVGNNNVPATKVGMKRVRPIPTTMEEVRHVLAVGRNYASRTSAPAGWNPNAPVVGFSTPNPLPHMLRGGTLAALQLEGAKQEAAEIDLKRKRQQEMELVASAKKKKQKEQAAEEEGQDAANNHNQNKKRKDEEGANAAAAAAVAKRRLSQQQQQQQQQRQSIQMKVTSMNLDSSSSSEDDDSD